MSNKQIIFTSLQNIKEHGQQNQLLLVAYKGLVYNLTDFQFKQHPGGPFVIDQFAYQKLDTVLFNPRYHKHHPKIILMLQKLKYGELKEETTDLEITPRSKSHEKILSVRKRLQFLEQPDSNLSVSDHTTLCSIQELEDKLIRKASDQPKTQRPCCGIF